MKPVKQKEYQLGSLSKKLKVRENVKNKRNPKVNVQENLGFLFENYNFKE